MTETHWSGVQEVPLSLRSNSLSEFGGDFVLKNDDTGRCLFLDDQEKFLVDALRQSATMADLVQQYHGRYRTYSYRKIVELVGRLLSSSFFVPKSESALLSFDAMKPFAPARPVRMLFVFPKLNFPRWIASVFGRMNSTFFLALMILSSFIGLGGLVTNFGDFEFARINGRCAPVLGMWVAGLCSVIVLKNLMKYFFLQAKGIHCGSSGIRLRWGIPVVQIDDGAVVILGRAQTLRFHLCAMLFPSLISVAALGAHFVSTSPAAGVWMTSCFLWMFMEASPFLQSELVKAIDRFSGASRLWESMSMFIRRKFIRRIFALRSTFGLELPMIAYGAYAILWVYAASVGVSFGFGREFDRLSDVAIVSESRIERLSAILMIAGILIPFFSIAAAAVRLIALNLLSAFERPINVIFGFLRSFSKPRLELSAADRAAFLKRIPLFAHLADEERLRLADAIEVRGIASGRVIVWQGEPGDAFFIIYRGETDVYREDDTGRRTKLAALSPGDSFGEISLLQDVPRTATVRANTAVSLFVLRKNAFESLVRSGIRDPGQITRMIQWTAFLKSSPMFSDLPPELMARVILEMEERKISKGDVIIREKDAAAEFFIILSGEAKVWKDYQKPAARELAALSAGDHFGEVALFDQSPRTATVVASAPTSILVMPRSAFFLILKSSVLSGVWVEETVQRRKRESVAG